MNLGLWKPKLELKMGDFCNRFATKTPNKGQRKALNAPDVGVSLIDTPTFTGDPHRNRTCNLLIKSQLLCQLS
jgi:hypothetical protein